MGKIEYPLYGQTPDGDELRTATQQGDYASKLLGMHVVGGTEHNFGRSISGNITYYLEDYDGFFNDIQYGADIAEARDYFNEIANLLQDVNPSLSDVFLRFSSKIANAADSILSLYDSTVNAVDFYTNASKNAQTDLENEIGGLANKLDQIGLK